MWYLVNGQSNKYGIKCFMSLNVTLIEENPDKWKGHEIARY